MYENEYRILAKLYQLSKENILFDFVYAEWVNTGSIMKFDNYYLSLIKPLFLDFTIPEIDNTLKRNIEWLSKKGDYTREKGTKE